MRHFRNRTQEDNHEQSSFALIDVLTTRWRLTHFPRSEGKKPGFFLSKPGIGSQDGDWSGHVDLENTHFYCFFISEEESKMATGHVTRGLRKFLFLLCIHFRRRIQDGYGSRDRWPGALRRLLRLNQLQTAAAREYKPCYLTS